MNKKIKYRHWRTDDFEAIRKVLAITWHETYNFIPEVDLNQHLNEFYSFDKLQDMYEDKNSICFSVETDNEVVAWMRLFNNLSDGKLYVSSLYVLPKYQGNGIGKELMRIAEERAVSLNHHEIWIGVMKDNVMTLNWYKKIGFNFIHQEPFRMGNKTVEHLIGFKSLR